MFAGVQCSWTVKPLLVLGDVGLLLYNTGQFITLLNVCVPDINSWARVTHEQWWFQNSAKCYTNLTFWPKSIPGVWQQCQLGIHWRTMCDIHNYVTEYVWISFKFFCFEIKPIKVWSFWIIFLLSYQSLVQLLTLLTRCWADQWMKRTVKH